MMYETLSKLLNSLSFSFPIYKMEIKIPMSENVIRSKRDALREAHCPQMVIIKQMPLLSPCNS